MVDARKGSCDENLKGSQSRNLEISKSHRLSESTSLLLEIMRCSTLRILLMKHRYTQWQRPILSHARYLSVTGIQLKQVIDLKERADDLEAPIFVDTYSKIRAKYETPHNPIVLCHGFLGFDRLDIVPKISFDKSPVDEGMVYFDYWRGIKVALEELGCTVMIGRVPAFGTIEDRAEILDKFISKQCAELQRSKPVEEIYNTHNNTHAHDRESPQNVAHEHLGRPVKVNLISHSMGGLDCRYLIWKNRTDNRKRNYEVASLTTISTPHHGSECADFLVNTAGGNALSKKILPPSVYELTTEKMKEFNEKVTDNPDVAYFSYGARFTPKWFNLFNVTWHIMNKMRKVRGGTHDANNDLRFSDNDGLVSVDSARWGEYLGTLDAVDHLDLINWTNQARTVLDKVLFQEDPKFNAIALYMDIADKLAKRGF